MKMSLMSKDVKFDVQHAEKNLIDLDNSLSENHSEKSDDQIQGSQQNFSDLKVSFAPDVKTSAVPKDIQENLEKNILGRPK